MKPTTWDDMLDALDREEHRDLTNCLSRTARLILCVLSHGERCSGAVARDARCDPADVSHYLKILRETGLVYVRRQGKERYYSLTPRTVISIEENALTMTLSRSDGASVSRTYPLAARHRSAESTTPAVELCAATVTTLGAVFQGPSPAARVRSATHPASAP